MTKRKPGSTTAPRHKWTDAEKERLTREYPDAHTPTLAESMGLSVGRVYQKALGMGLRKSEAYLAGPLAGRTDGQRGGETRFKAGQTSWNKGVKGICGTHPNSRRTQFKKGSMSGAAQRNYVPIGSYRISKDGYLEQKTNDDHPVPARRWIAVHRLVWEAANGPIPKSHVVCFLPGRRTNELEKITLDALELVHRGELARRNHPRSRSPELAKLVQLKGAITRQVNRIAREAKEQES